MQIRIWKNKVREHLSALDQFKSLGLDRLHPRVLKEPAKVISESLKHVSKSLEPGSTLGLLTRVHLVTEVTMIMKKERYDHFSHIIDHCSIPPWLCDLYSDA
uniref:Uncharacterized protein n=1 Tax=Micrurus spixii TaxID=129469 RepID=A0A2D4M3K0_9SAUR